MVSQRRLAKLSLLLNVIAVVIGCVCCDWSCMSSVSVKQVCDHAYDCVEKNDERSEDRCDAPAAMYRRNPTEITIQPTFTAVQSTPPTVVTEGSCLTPTIKNGRMLWELSPNKSITPAESVPSFASTIYECEPGFTLEGRHDNFCLRGSWMGIHPICTRYCPNKELHAVSHNAICLTGDATVVCNDRIKPGTIAKVICSNKYKALNSGQTILCTESGQWDYSPKRCEPICGEELPANQAFQVNGEVTNITSIPWHVGVYKLMGNDYEHNCGGTIINANVIISAAHCFWDNANQATYNMAIYVIGAGKFNRGYSADEPINVQFRGISNIFIPPNYNGEYARFKADIAVITLNSSLEFSDFIAPVCIEWQNLGAKFFANNLYGTVAGWGIDESGQSSNELKTIYVQGNSYEACRNAAGPKHEQSLADDKFCVINTSGSNPCRGDSGGGFVVKKEIGGKTLHYLWGVVSTGVPLGNTCSNLQFVSMTNIQFYEELILEVEVRHRPT